MKILHVFDHSLPLQSGYSFRSMAILMQQRARGWNTVHLTSAKQGASATAVEHVNDLQFYRTPVWQSKWTRLPPLDQFAVVASLRQRLREVIALEQPDIIHAHSPCLNALATFGLGKPVLYELRSSWEDAAVSLGTTTEGSLRYRVSRALETRVMLHADAVVTICEGLRQDVMLRGVPADKIAVVPNAVDVDRFANRRPGIVDMRARHGLQGKMVLGFAGSFYAWEGLTLLVKALGLIVKQRDDVRVLLVGSGPDEPMIRAAVTELGLDRYVIFTGQVKNAEVESFYDAMDVLVFPRPATRLTDMVTPLKPLEAMALSKVFVASDVGGHRELVKHEHTGILFQAGNVEALASAALRLIGDAGLRRRVTESGLYFVQEERTWKKSVAEYEPVYEKLLTSSRV